MGEIIQGRILIKKIRLYKICPIFVGSINIFDESKYCLVINCASILRPENQILCRLWYTFTMSQQLVLVKREY